MRLYLACFDIEDDKNRRKLGHLFLHYGQRVQYSVFEISLKDERQLDRLRAQCQRYIAPGDSLYFYWITQQGAAKSKDVDGNPIAQYPAVIVL
ncbi:CRISPR-associated endonuclease Cas2 [Teredinibacter turnerae]|uniref:CRISPR-associated endonuclease Cas2 n=1 Tax=Teredinibacter turnerae TaxID=2426 RepID=UPI000366D709|nr:CRISPR-associated endonuclease Cas2 [Teredinibacter turnerae]